MSLVSGTQYIVQLFSATVHCFLLVASHSNLWFQIIWVVRALNVLFAIHHVKRNSTTDFSRSIANNSQGSKFQELVKFQTNDGSSECVEWVTWDKWGKWTLKGPRDTSASRADSTRAIWGVHPVQGVHMDRGCRMDHMWLVSSTVHMDPMGPTEL